MRQRYMASLGGPEHESDIDQLTLLVTEAR
jgi:hypothetical protein